MLFNAARGNGRRHAENIKKQPFEHTVWRFYVLVDKIGQQTAYSLNIQAHYLLHPSLFFCYNLAAILLLTLHAVQRKAYDTALNTPRKYSQTPATGLDKNSDRRPATERPDIQCIAIHGLCLPICRILHDKRWLSQCKKPPFINNVIICT